MTPRAPQAPRSASVRWRMLAVVALTALSVSGCLKRGATEITGAIPGPQQATPEIWRKQADVWGPRFDANPGDPTAAMHYARALRALDQKPQAVAVLLTVSRWVTNPADSAEPLRGRISATAAVPETVPESRSEPETVVLTS